MSLDNELQQIDDGANNTVPINENFAAIPNLCYAKNAVTTELLTWGYLGGRWGGFTVAAGTLTLADDDVSYIVVDRSDGSISEDTATTNWNDTGNYARVYQVTTADGVVTDVEDHRSGTYGVHGVQSSAAAGKHAIPVMAAAMQPSVSGGCAALAAIASAANQPDIVTLDFSSSATEYAQFSIPMPKSWDEGTVTFKPIWSHAATTTDFGVVWSLQAVAVSNDDGIAAAFGTAQTSTDTGGTTNDIYVGPESSAITIAGTPAAEDVVFFRIARIHDDAADTMAIDARLHGIVLYITTDADNDA